MTLKIINKTHWKSEQLRAIFSRCLTEVRKYEGSTWELNTLKVNVVHKKLRNPRYTCLGSYAWVKSNAMVLKLPYEKPSLPNIIFAYEVARTFIHELGHCIGIKKHHNRHTMEGLYKVWLKEEFTDEKYPIEKREVPKQLPLTDDEKLERVRGRIKRLTTKKKRLETLIKKARKQEKYYEKKKMGVNQVGINSDGGSGLPEVPRAE